MRIAVIGSLNIDIVNRVARLPQPGETLEAGRSFRHCGGKGANQAVAAARCGASVAMIGAVGQDANGERLRQQLENDGIYLGLTFQKPEPTGAAFITVDEQGENHIVLSPGANVAWTIDDIADASGSDVWSGFDFALLQNEIPWELNRHFIQTLPSLGVKVVFNPAPAKPISPGLLSGLHTLVLNETEAESIAGCRIGRERDAAACAKHLVDAGVYEAIVTLGPKGSLYCNRDGIERFTPAYPVKAVDTTAAGDTFIGAFAAARSRGRELEQSLQFATAASALTVSRHGAQESIPFEREIEHFIAANRQPS